MPNVRAKRVLILGDSLSRGPTTYSDSRITSASTTRAAPSFGSLLASHCLRHGASYVWLNSRVGRSAASFFTAEGGTSLLTQLIAHKPDVVFVILGTNDIGLNMSADQGYMSAIATAFTKTGAQVWGVGPPAFASRLNMAAGADQVVAMMKPVFGSRFVDLRSLTHDMLTTSTGREPDGIHFNRAGNHVVADRLARKLLTGRRRAGMWGAGIIMAGLMLGGVGVVVWRRRRLGASSQNEEWD